MNKYFKRYVVDAFGGMSLGLFSTLIIGLIIKQIGGFFPSAVGSGGAGGASASVYAFLAYAGRFFMLTGQVLTVLTGAGIACGVAHSLGAPKLALYGSILTGTIGAYSVKCLAYVSAGQAAFIAEKQSKPLSDGLSRTHDFPMRPEQQAAVEKTAAYFREFQREEGITPHFLWNAKMRFGKTFAAYQLAKEMGWKRVLVLTFKPAVLSAWREDLLSHTDFAGWQFVSNYEEDLSFDAADKTRPLVFFGSFQDLLGKDKSGGIKAKNEQVHTVNWDCVIFDEYHYGAWREKSKDLFDKEEQAAIKTIEAELADMEADNPDYFDEKLLPITTSHYLYLSGTPFRAISSGEFIEEQIFNWTYPDEQKAKRSWPSENGANPYAALPGMKMFTYTLPESIRHVAEQGEFDEFDLNAFFATEGSGEDARFKNEEYVQKWLDLIRGSYRDTMVDDLKLGKEKPPMPFSDVRLLGVLQHTFWFLPNVARAEGGIMSN